MKFSIGSLFKFFVHLLFYSTLSYILYYYYCFVTSNEAVMNINGDNITLVSGYWKVVNKYERTLDHTGRGQWYVRWMNNTLEINQRYVFFIPNSSHLLRFIKHKREKYETVYINYNINNFYSKQFINSSWVHPANVPSIELSAIWHEKIHLMKLAKNMDKTPTDFYMWIDAAIVVYRQQKPPTLRLSLKDVNSLPKDKFIYSAENRIVTGSAFMMHRSMIDRFHSLYYQELPKCQNNETTEHLCGQDQNIFKIMRKKYPSMFYKLSCGYGNILVDLYEDYV